MARSPKRGKHLQWWEIMAFICPWQGWWDHGSWGQDIHAWQKAIARSIVTPLLFPSRAPICVGPDWLVAWTRVMWLKKVLMFFVDELLWLYCCPTTFPCVKKAPDSIGPRIPSLCVVGQTFLKKAMMWRSLQLRYHTVQHKA